MYSEEEVFCALDKFRAEQPNELSRADAIRTILLDWLVGSGYLANSPTNNQDANVQGGGVLIGNGQCFDVEP